MANWKGNQVVVQGNLLLNEKHEKLPPGMIVEGGISATKAKIAKYENLTCYGSMSVEGNSSIQRMEQSARILGTEPGLIANPTADDERHINNAMKRGASRSPGVLHIESIPHKMECLKPSTTGETVFYGTSATDIDTTGVGDHYSQSKMEYHYAHRMDAAASQSHKRAPASMNAPSATPSRPPVIQPTQITGNASRV